MTHTRRHFFNLALASVVATLCGHRIALATNQTKSQPMNEEQFWRIIEAAKGAAGKDTDARPVALERQL